MVVSIALYHSPGCKNWSSTERTRKKDQKQDRLWLGPRKTHFSFWGFTNQRSSRADTGTGHSCAESDIARIIRGLARAFQACFKLQVLKLCFALLGLLCLLLGPPVSSSLSTFVNVCVIRVVGILPVACDFLQSRQSHLCSQPYPPAKCSSYKLIHRYQFIINVDFIINSVIEVCLPETKCSVSTSGVALRLMRL